ncbi:YqeB family protein [Corynebacterium flavescens]|uniref:YqeB family protein n=1 Tax=Corynebacterium flavescens TaxID=28028 RepID=UPI003FD0B302
MSESTSNTITVGISSRYLTVFTAGGALIGLISSFIVGPVVSWLLSLIGDAPGPLRLAAELPLALAIPVLTIIGAVAGFLIASSWIRDAGTIDVGGMGSPFIRKTLTSSSPKIGSPTSSRNRVLWSSSMTTAVSYFGARWTKT